MLIWLSVVALATEVGEVELVSNNHKDFAADEEHSEDLHLNLTDDLVAKGLYGAVRLRSSLEAVVEEITTRATEVVDELNRLLTDGDDSMKRQLLDSLIGGQHDELAVGPFDSIFPLVEPRLLAPTNNVSLVADDARDAGDGRFLVTPDARVWAQIEAKVWPGGLEEMASLADLGRWTRELHSTKLPDGSTVATVYAPIWTSFAALFEPSTKRLTNIQSGYPMISEFGPVRFDEE